MGKKKVSISWTPFWWAGFLFSLGLVGPDPLLHTYSLGEQIVIWVVSWLLWPLILGQHLR